MTDPTQELPLENFPKPTLYRLQNSEGQDVRQRTEVTGEPASIAAVFADRNLAEEFSANARDLGMEDFAGCEPATLSSWSELEEFASEGSDYVLVVSTSGTGLFHASDVVHHATESAGGMQFPIYVISDERGESPLILVPSNGEEILMAALFTTPDKARAFRERAAQLELPDGFGEISTPDGLSRHALVARKAGADYAVLDPDSGLSEAIPLEEFIG